MGKQTLLGIALAFMLVGCSEFNSDDKKSSPGLDEEILTLNLSGKVASDLDKADMEEMASVAQQLSRLTGTNISMTFPNGFNRLTQLTAKESEAIKVELTDNLPGIFEDCQLVSNTKPSHTAYFMRDNNDGDDVECGYRLSGADDSTKTKQVQYSKTTETTNLVLERLKNSENPIRFVTVTIVETNESKGVDEVGYTSDNKISKSFVLKVGHDNGYDYHLKTKSINQELKTKIGDGVYDTIKKDQFLAGVITPGNRMTYHWQKEVNPFKEKRITETVRINAREIPN